MPHCIQSLCLYSLTYVHQYRIMNILIYELLFNTIFIHFHIQPLENLSYCYYDLWTCPNSFFEFFLTFPKLQVFQAHFVFSWPSLGINSFLKEPQFLVQDTDIQKPGSECQVCSLPLIYHCFCALSANKLGNTCMLPACTHTYICLCMLYVFKYAYFKVTSS